MWRRIWSNSSFIRFASSIDVGIVAALWKNHKIQHCYICHHLYTYLQAAASGQGESYFSYCLTSSILHRMIWSEDADLGGMVMDIMDDTTRNKFEPFENLLSVGRRLALHNYYCFFSQDKHYLNLFINIPSIYMLCIYKPFRNT